MELLDTTVRDSEEVEALTALPILAEVSQLDSVAADVRRNFFANAESRRCAWLLTASRYRRRPNRVAACARPCWWRRVIGRKFWL